MSIKIKGMDIPGDCYSCPLLVQNSYGIRRCFVTDEYIQSYRMDERSANCPVEEVEE